MNNTRERFGVRLVMKSDWHVGTGAGRPGSVDKLLARDGEGFPYVPAKTLNGIWRDAMERLTLGLDNGGTNEQGQRLCAWQKFVELIFGIQPNEIKREELDHRVANQESTYSFSLLFVQPARLDHSLRRKVNSFETNSRTKFLSALTFIKPGVAIEDDSGTSKPDFLRFEEMGRSGTILRAECELDFENLRKIDEKQKQSIKALLVASAKLVERIGGKRRRGAGRCELSVNDLMSDEEAIAQLESLKGNVEGLTLSPEAPTSSYNLNRTSSANEWQRLEYSMTLRTPVSIVTATLGNVSESLDFVPGTYLLPHFTRVLGKEIFNAVAYGDFRVSPATIEINGERGLPVPRVLAVTKVGGGFQKKGTVFNTFHDEIPEGVQIKNQREGYIGNFCVSLDGKTRLPSLELAPRTLLMHNVVKDELQRPTEDVGGLFSREAIAAKRAANGETRPTVLRGEISFRKFVGDRLGANWWKKFETSQNNVLRVGTSRKDDYGLVELKILGAPTEIEPAFPFKADELIVYLLSDVLIRNDQVRQATLAENLAEAICRKLNEYIKDDSLKLRLDVCELSKEELEKGKTASLVQARRIESWHEAWGFPRPTLIAMAAGSCVRFQVKNGRLDEAALKELEAEGIGERRGEGYGQIRFNPPLLMNAVNTWTPTAEPNEVPKTNDQSSPSPLMEDDFVKQIEEAVWRDELKVAVLKIANDSEKRKQIFGFEFEPRRAEKVSIPPMSQIGALRSAISRLKNTEESQRLVSQWLDHLDATSNRIKKWGKDDSEGRAKNKTKEIKRLIENEDYVWQRLSAEFITPPVLLRPITDLQQKLWVDAVRSLLDACARAHKRDLEKSAKEQVQDGAKN